MGSNQYTEIAVHPAAVVESSVVNPCSDSELEQQKPSLIAGGIAEWQSLWKRDWQLLAELDTVLA